MDLASGSRMVIGVRSNTLTPYMKVELERRRERLTVSWTRSLLGVVPLRRRTITVSLASVRLRPRLFLDRLAVCGGLIAVLILDLVQSMWFRSLLGVLAGVMAFLSLVMVLFATTDEGPAQVVPICWRKRGLLARFLRGE